MEPKAMQAMFALARYAVWTNDRSVLLWLASLTQGQVHLFFGRQP